jgi:hypothetical protein
MNIYQFIIYLAEHDLASTGFLLFLLAIAALFFAGCLVETTIKAIARK